MPERAFMLSVKKVAIYLACHLIRSQRILLIYHGTSAECVNDAGAFLRITSVADKGLVDTQEKRL
jgi:hypothetical protein